MTKTKEETVDRSKPIPINRSKPIKQKESKSLYSIQLEKFVGKNVEVSNLIGDKVKGKCIAVNKSHLNIILETTNNILIIKNINTIRRNK